MVNYSFLSVPQREDKGPLGWHIFRVQYSYRQKSFFKNCFFFWVFIFCLFKTSIKQEQHIFQSALSRSFILNYDQYVIGNGVWLRSPHILLVRQQAILQQSLRSQSPVYLWWELIYYFRSPIIMAGLTCQAVRQKISLLDHQLPPSLYSL